MYEKEKNNNLAVLIEFICFDFLVWQMTHKINGDDNFNFKLAVLG